MYGIFGYIYPINDPNVGRYTIHGSSGSEVGEEKKTRLRQWRGVKLDDVEPRDRLQHLSRLDRGKLRVSWLEARGPWPVL